jgi:crotonobetainyl-CoA:carnitine CoA-transferase CaiB-like acyl-CoA transferase
MLEELKVLDLTDEKGLLCGKTLADMGAEVICVQKPGQAIADCYANRGKHAVSLNFESPRGKDLFLRLVDKNDVLIESFTPGYMAGLGLSFERLKEQNPRLIMASITGFGQTGPYSRFHTSELVSAAMSGQVYLNGEPGRPPIQPPVPLASSLACLNAVTGILLAVRHRHTTAQGQYLDISIQECTAAALDHTLVRYAHLGETAARSGNFNWNRSMRVFPCRDGYILLSLFHQWETLVEWLDSENMAGDLTDQKYLIEEERHRNLDHIVRVLEKWTLSHGVDDLVETGQAMHFPWGKVNSIPELVEGIQLNARGYFVPVQDLAGHEYKFPGAPVKMSESLWQVNSQLPAAGEYNQEVFCRRLGLSETEVEQLAREGVI